MLGMKHPNGAKLVGWAYRSLLKEMAVHTEWWSIGSCGWGWGICPDPWDVDVYFKYEWKGTKTAHDDGLGRRRHISDDDRVSTKALVPNTRPMSARNRSPCEIRKQMREMNMEWWTPKVFYLKKRRRATNKIRFSPTNAIHWIRWSFLYKFLNCFQKFWLLLTFTLAILQHFVLLRCELLPTKISLYAHFAHITSHFFGSNLKCLIDFLILTC